MAKPSAIRPVSEVTDWVRMMVVAGSGWGKTPFAGTADTRNQVGGMRALFLSCDPEGVTSAFVAGSTADVWVIKTWKEMEEAYRWLRDEGCDEYQVIVVDSLNEAQKINQKAILSLPSRSAKNDPDVLSQQDYQRNQIHMVDFVKQMNDLPIHIIWNVQWRKEDDETDLGFRYEPMIHGQKGDLAEQIKGYMKIIAYGTQKKVKVGDKVEERRRLIFTQQPPFMARDRTGALGTHMDNPNFPAVVEKVQKKLAEARKLASSAGPRGPRSAARAPKKAAPVKRAVRRTA